MKRQFKPQLESAVRHDVRPGDVGWKFLSFSVTALDQGKTLTNNTGNEEIAIIPLTGRATVSYRQSAKAEGSHRVGRDDLFRELTDIVYLPPGADYEIEATQPVEIAIGGAPATGKFPPRLIRHEEMPVFTRGGANVKRGVSTLIDSDEITERLTIYEIRAPSGNWSSFPGHRHDTRNSSSYHEETYYYRLSPANGFALQRIYTRDTDLDVALTIGDGDLVLIHEGYHPVVNAPGTNAYYLNFLAGDVRKISPMNDPHYDWVTKQWDGNPLDIERPMG